MKETNCQSNVNVIAGLKAVKRREKRTFEQSNSIRKKHIHEEGDACKEDKEQGSGYHTSSEVDLRHIDERVAESN